MPADVHWHDADTESILIVATSGAWDWRDLHHAVARGGLRAAQLDHAIDLILDLSGGRLPAGAVGQLRSLAKSIARTHPPRVIVLGIDAAVQTQMGAVNGVYTGKGGALYFVSDRAAALAQIADWRA